MSDLKSMLEYDETFSCVQCGYCLPACPTYQVLEKESASPRGRIALVKAAAEGKIGLLEHLAGPIDLCLGCRACETVCPTGVQYGTILEGAKQTIEAERKVQWKRRPVTNWIRKVVFEQLFPHPSRLKALTNLIWMYQKSGLQRVAQSTGIMQKMPLHLAEFEQALPAVPSPLAYRKRQRVVAAAGERRVKVAFFAGCVMDSVFYETNQKSIELLTAAGCEVVIPPAQTCCGALHSHAGETEKAKELAKRNIAAFEASGADWIVNNAGGCGAMLSEYGHLLADDPEWSERAKRFTGKSRDISVILAELGTLPLQKQIPLRVTYQDSCHLRNVQQVTSQPRDLLRKIPGIELAELPGADSCCGSAGIYSLVQYETSMKVLDDKMKAVESTQAAVIATSNPGCLLQMRMGIQREGLEEKIKAVHLVDLLHEACDL